MYYDYEFDEVEIELGGVYFLVSGNMEVEYDMLPAEPDIGIFNKYPEITTINKIFVKILNWEDDSLDGALEEYPVDSEMAKAIFDEVYDDMVDGI